MREQHLQRDHPVDFRVVGPPGLARAAMTELLDQPVAAERRAIHLLSAVDRADSRAADI
jgi:hypothetical protein